MGLKGGIQELMDLLEEALVEHEKQLDVALKHSTQLTNTLKAWKKATAEGNLADRQKQADRAIELSGALGEPIRQAADAWNFDSREYLATESWLGEMLATAKASGHRVFVEGDTLISSPVMVRCDPQRQSLLIGKTRWGKIRPSLVIQELQKLRAKGEKQKAIQESMDALFAATKFLDKHPGPTGAVKAKIRDIYDLFSLTPGWKKDNPEAAFAQDLYALHRSDLRVTRGGMRYEFEFPTGQPKARDLFEVIDETGRPIRYYMIHFR